jgi:hypothetical protein
VMSMFNRTLISLVSVSTFASPLINRGKGTLHIKDFYVSRSSFSFIRSSANLFIEKSTFKRFSDTAVVIASDFYKGKDFTNYFDDTNSTFLSCNFLNCLSRAIYSKKSFDRVRVYSCLFSNCYDSREGNELERAGGAVYCTNTYSLIASSRFVYCHGDGYGQAIYFKTKESDMTNTVFLQCHNETRNFDSSVYVHSEKAIVQNINITQAVSRGNAGFSIQYQDKDSCFKYYHAEDLSGQAVLTNRVFYALEYGNIINSTATHGLVKSDFTNTYISHYYFYQNHRSPLVSRHVSYLTTMSNCIFCDVDEKPMEKLLAVVNSFDVSFKNQKIFTDPNPLTRNYKAKVVTEKKGGVSWVLVLIATVIVMAGIFFVLQHFRIMEKIQPAITITGKEEKTYIVNKLKEKKYK